MLEYQDIEKKHYKLIKIAENYMSTIEDKEHDINHMKDVVSYVKELLSVLQIDIDKEVCIISAYWHDVGRTKIVDGHEKISAQMLKQEMINLKYEEYFIEKCYKAVENHGWNMNPKTKEGLIIKDADKLAFIGKGRWNSCISNNQRLDSIMNLLPELKLNIFYFDESKKIFDRDILNLVRLLYEEIYK